MSSYIAGLVLSVVVSGMLLMLFRHEERRGARYVEGVRAWFDGVVMRVARAWHGFLRMLGKDSLRQIFHYILHTLLGFVLYLNKRWEQALRAMMRINKNLARNAERERTSRTQLEELMLHKAQHTLTDEEKRIRKAKSLEGDN